MDAYQLVAHAITWVQPSGLTMCRINLFHGYIKIDHRTCKTRQGATAERERGTKLKQT